MYLKMILADQFIEECVIADSTVYKGDFLQSAIEKMVYDHDELIEDCGEQPQFILSQYPTQKKKERILPAVFSKLSFLQKMMGQ
jgi:hypothetical protein